MKIIFKDVGEVIIETDCMKKTELDKERKK